MPDELTRRNLFWPQFDNRKFGKGGAQGVIAEFELRGPLGAAVFGFDTGWVSRPFKGFPIFSSRLDEPGVDVALAELFPRGRALVLHSPIRRHSMTDGDVVNECPHLDGVHCYTDASFSEAETLLKVLVEHGHEAVWEKLIGWYESIESREPCDKDGCHAC